MSDAGVKGNLRIKEMNEVYRPRNRLTRDGAAALSDPELLAIIINSGTRTENAIMLSQRLLAMGNLKTLSTTPASDLMRVHGIKEAKAAQIIACFELARRLESFKDEPRPKIGSPADVYSLIYPRVRGVQKEIFIELCLNTKNQVIREEMVSLGTLNANIVHPREVFKTALSESAAAIIVAHNHPSGDPTPSREDIEITKKLVEAGKIMGIELLDHVVIGDGVHVSMKQEGFV